MTGSRKEECSIIVTVGKAKKFFEYILVLAVFVNNYTMIERDTFFHFPEFVQVLMFGFACASLILLNLLQGVSQPKAAILAGASLIILISIENTVVPGSPFIQGLLKWFMPIAACSLLCLTVKDTKEIWLRFVNVVFLFAVAALVLYIFGSILHIIPPTRQVSFLYFKEYKRCKSYFNLFYESQEMQTGMLGIAYRNTGIFIEAPMYNLVLCIAFAAEMSFSKVPRKIVLLVLGASILSTFTSTGIIFLLLMALIYIWNSGDSKLGKVLKVGIVPAAIVAVYIMIKSVLAEKLNSAAGSGSMSVRTDHLKASIQMFLHNPIIGYGFGNSEAFYQYTKIDQGLSIGLPALLGRNGLPIFLMYLVPFIARILDSLKREKKQLYFWVGTFFCFVVTASIYKLIFILLLCTQLLWTEKEERITLSSILEATQKT